MLRYLFTISLLFYKWGKVKIIHYLRQKGIEEVFISEAILEINQPQYLRIIQEEAQKKFQTMNTPNDYRSKQNF